MTGTRDVPEGGYEVMEEALTSRVIEALEPTSLSSGSQYGADTEAALIFARAYPDRKQVIWVPDARCNSELYVAVRAEVDLPELVSVHFLLKQPGETDAAVYLRRNGNVLDGGKDALLGFPADARERRRGSGTWACIREARRRGIPRFIFPLDGSPPWTEA